jgi:predicted nucleic acid-binding protein
LDAEIKRAVITSNGKLTPNFEYIAELRQRNHEKMNTLMKKSEVNKIEIGATESILHTNVTIIPKEKIKGEKLSFDDV